MSATDPTPDVFPGQSAGLSPGQSRLWGTDGHIYSKRQRIDPSASATQLLLGQDYAESECPQDVQLEVDNYFKEISIPPDDNPLQWWKVNSARLSRLSVLAQQYLCVPATSVPSERVFSAASLIFNRLRTRLLPEHVDMIIFLRQNCQTQKSEL